MDLNITNKVKNDLFKREEIKGTVISEMTPTDEEMKEALASKENKDKKSILIKNIKGRFGSNEFIVDAYIYKDEKSMKEFEGVVEEEKKPAENKPAEGEQPVAEQKEEKPAEKPVAEEKKEEPKEAS